MIISIITMTSPTISSSTTIFPYPNLIIFTTKMKINFASSKKHLIFAVHYYK